MQVRASDPDEGENSRVEYRLLSVRRESEPETQQAQPFAIPLVIHLVSGDLLVNASLENFQTGYSTNLYVYSYAYKVDQNNTALVKE